MRPAPLAAGFQRPRPGSVSRSANPGSSAKARRDRLSAMPLAVTHFTNSRRVVGIASPLVGIAHAGWVERSETHRCAAALETAIAGLDPAILHLQKILIKKVDPRVKSAGDAGEVRRE